MAALVVAVAMLVAYLLAGVIPRVLHRRAWARFMADLERQAHGEEMARQSGPPCWHKVDRAGGEPPVAWCGREATTCPACPRRGVEL